MSEKKKPLYDALNSPASLLILGFVLTTIAGSYISHIFHEQSWKSQARFEVFKERFNEAANAQGEILATSNDRLFYLRRIYSELKADRLQSGRKLWKEYYQAVIKWNANVKSNAAKLAIFFGEEISIIFLDEKENKKENPSSLHHRFRTTHESILGVIECMKNECEQSKIESLLTDSERNLNMLGLTHDKFAVGVITESGV